MNNAEGAKTLANKGNNPQNAEGANAALNEIENYIQNLCNFGAISKDLGNLIRENLVKSMNNGTSKPKNQADIEVEPVQEDYSKFFETRKSLKNYLENAGLELDKAEFEKIFQLVEELENAAIERFKQVSASGENLKLTNENALQKLKTASSQAISGPLDVSKKFTLEQIGKMSPTEFKKNEAVINKLLREGKL